MIKIGQLNFVIVFSESIEEVDWIGRSFTLHMKVRILMMDQINLGDQI